MHRPGESNLLLVNVYGHADRRHLDNKELLYSEIGEFVCAHGGDVLLVGDHNALWTEQPLSGIVAAGRWKMMDEAFDDVKPTRHSRVIDYGLGFGVVCCGRQQVNTCSDHDCVAYDVGLKSAIQGK